MKHIHGNRHLGFLFLIALMQLHMAFPQNVPENLRQKFQQYIKAVPREDIFVHSDRETYIAGENVWFSVYLLDRQSFKASENSRITYFELLNPENRPVIQKKILMENGFGPGVITLPDTLRNGKYTIRAYSNWMKNFLPENCFMKDITVYNALNTGAFKEKSVRVKETGSGTQNMVLNNQVSLDVDNTRPGNIELLIKSTPRFRALNNNTVYVFIQTHGNINRVSTEKTDSDSAQIIISRDLLMAGINQITLFDLKGQPVAERYIYTPGIPGEIPALKITDSCGLRDRIILEAFGAKTTAKVPADGNLSISVVPAHDMPESPGIDAYMILGSEFGLKANEIIKAGDLSQSGMDSLLMHAGSNWIDWKAILTGKMPHLTWSHEKDGQFLSGRLYSDGSKPVSSGVSVLLCIPGKVAGFQYTFTDDKGYFSFNIPIDNLQKDLILMPGNLNSGYKIIPRSSFSDVYPAAAMIDSVRKPVPPFVSRLSINYQVNTLYGTSGLGNPVKVLLTPLKKHRFYGKPDFELVMADYINLPVMEEVFFEILPHVSLKKKETDFEIIITDRVDNQPYSARPTIMIDGIIIREPALIINLDPDMVEKIDVIKEKYMVGGFAFPGIVNVITKAGDFSAVTLPDYMVRIPYRVADPVASFVSPDYSTPEKKKSRIADYRNTLYWNPSFRADAAVTPKTEFWSSDNAGDYVINVQGIMPDGSFCSYQKKLKVR
jgi:hypothetical protein